MWSERGSNLVGESDEVTASAKEIKVKEYKKCTVQHDDEKREVLLPEDKAHVGEKIVIKEPDRSGVWEVVDLVKITGGSSESSQG